MKKRHALIGILLALTLLLAGCATQNAESGNESSSAVSTSSVVNEDVDTMDTGFSYSDGLDENGFFEGITALDYVELFEYGGMTISSDIHEISEEQVETERNSLLESYNTSEQITDRAVADGDTVNIDYVGSVDGKEFDGGNTNGVGTEVTIGVTSYIDDFLEQLIGHNPGDTFDVEVTFPEDYQEESLQGKDAVFQTTINHIVETNEAELTDSFVTDNFKETYGWATIEDLNNGLRTNLQQTAISKYLQDELVNLATVTNTPDSLVKYQEDSMVYYYQSYAEYYQMEFDEYLTNNLNVSSKEELLETNADTLKEAADYYLIIQAIAEDADLRVTDENLKTYFSEQFGSEDYSAYEEEYGLPYLKQVVLTQLVIDYIAEHAVLA